MIKSKYILMPCLTALVLLTVTGTAQSRRTHRANNYPDYSSRRNSLEVRSSSYFENNSSVTLGSPRNPGGNPDVPIDGGISLLVAAGAAFGAKKARDARKKLKDKETI